MMLKSWHVVFNLRNLSSVRKILLSINTSTTILVVDENSCKCDILKINIILEESRGKLEKLLNKCG